jgi:hypothetical protein
MPIIIGRLEFVDGTTRDVYRDEQGQYVQGDDGQPVYGVWILDAEAIDDAPLVIDASTDFALPGSPRP